MREICGRTARLSEIPTRHVSCNAHTGAPARSITARIRVLRVKVSLGATRANVSVCFMLHSDCAAYVHLRCSHGHAPGADLKWKERAGEAESA